MLFPFLLLLLIVCCTRTIDAEDHSNCHHSVRFVNQIDGRLATRAQQEDVRDPHGGGQSVKVTREPPKVHFDPSGRSLTSVAPEMR